MIMLSHSSKQQWDTWNKEEQTLCVTVKHGMMQSHTVCGSELPGMTQSYPIETQ